MTKFCLSIAKDHLVKRGYFLLSFQRNDERKKPLSSFLWNVEGIISKMTVHVDSVSVLKIQSDFIFILILNHYSAKARVILLNT